MHNINKECPRQKQSNYLAIKSLGSQNSLTALLSSTEIATVSAVAGASFASIIIS